MPPAVAMVLAVVVVAEIAWAAFVLAGSDDLRPHAVPAVVAADPVVAESVARQYDDLPGDPFDLRAVTNEDTARAALDDGSARAALIVDLEGSVGTWTSMTTGSHSCSPAVSWRTGRVGTGTHGVDLTNPDLACRPGHRGGAFGPT